MRLMTPPFPAASRPSNHDNLLFVVDDPVLQPDEFGLQRQERSEVFHARDRGRMGRAIDPANFLRQRRYGKLEFVVLVDRVGQFCFEPVDLFVLAC